MKLKVFPLTTILPLSVLTIILNWSSHDMTIGVLLLMISVVLNASIKMNIKMAAAISLMKPPSPLVRFLTSKFGLHSFPVDSVIMLSPLVPTAPRSREGSTLPTEMT